MDAVAFLAETLVKYVPEAVRSIKRNQHLHFFRGDITPDEVATAITRFNTFAMGTDKLRECRLAIELLTLLTEIAKDFRRTTPDLDADALDAVLADYINGIAARQYGIDYALHAGDLRD